MVRRFPSLLKRMLKRCAVFALLSSSSSTGVTDIIIYFKSRRKLARFWVVLFFARNWFPSNLLLAVVYLRLLWRIAPSYFQSISCSSLPYHCRTGISSIYMWLNHSISRCLIWLVILTEKHLSQSLLAL